MADHASASGLTDSMSATIEALIAALIARSQDPTTLAILVSIVTIAILTRLTSGKAETKVDGGRTPFSPGYWLPFLGHVPQMAWDADGFLGKMRDRSPAGAFSLNLMGSRHTFVHQPAMVTALMNKPHHVVDDEWIPDRLMFSNFGFIAPKGMDWKAGFQQLAGLYKHLLSGPSLSGMVEQTVKNIKHSIGDWVTFNSYPSDQMDWERQANADVVETPSGERFVEADLMELVKNFVAKTANPTLFGTDLDSNFEDIAQCIWDFDAAFVLFASGTPGWVPWPRLQKAQNARRKMISYMSEYHEAWERQLNGEDPGLRWQDLESASTMIKERIQVFRSLNWPIQARASVDFALIWAMNGNANPLTFWIIYEIFRDPVLLEQIREEIAPYVKAVQPKNEFHLGVWIGPKLEKVDIDGLITKCPLLKSAYVETLRLYTGAWSIKWLKESTSLKNKGDDGCMLQKGDYAHAPHEVHQLDPRYFPDPDEWHATRHVKEEVDEKGNLTRTADLGTIRPFGKFPFLTQQCSMRTCRALAIILLLEMLTVLAKQGAGMLCAKAGPMRSGN
jgi:cytochrome P450